MIKKDRIRLAFTGDILSYEIQDKRSHVSGNDYDYRPYLEATQPLFDDADFSIGSIETTCAGKKARYTHDTQSFNTPEGILDAIKECGIDLLTTANNHSLDRGVDGLKATIKALDRHEILHTGTFEADEKNWLSVDIGGLKIAFVSYTYGTNSDVNGCLLTESQKCFVNLTQRQKSPTQRSFIKILVRSLFGILPHCVQECVRPKRYVVQQDCSTKEDLTRIENEPYMNIMKQTIHKAKESSDFVVFCLHSGGQFNSSVGEYTRRLVEDITEAGADVVVCNHSHCVLPISYKGDKVIAFALGNFAFTPNEGYYLEGVYADYSIVLYLDISTKYKRVEDVSFSICKSVRDSDGSSRVIPIHVLSEQMSDKDNLLTDINAVVSRLVGHSVDLKDIQSKYNLKQFI